MKKRLIFDYCNTNSMTNTTTSNLKLSQIIKKGNIDIEKHFELFVDDKTFKKIDFLGLKQF